MKPLTTEPSLVEPQPVGKAYNVVWEDSSHFPLNDEPFETKAEAWIFILDDLGLKIVEVKPINKRGPRFE
jgi:hypothetical protein